MSTSPVIAKALMEARQRDLLAAARRARLAQEAQQAARTARGAPPVTPAPHVARRRWRLRLAGLFGAQ
jgi:hypothetical protein